jgi:hypothetical protein
MAGRRPSAGKNFLAIDSIFILYIIFPEKEANYFKVPGRSKKDERSALAG